MKHLPSTRLNICIVKNGVCTICLNKVEPFNKIEINCHPKQSKVHAWCANKEYNI